MAEKVIFEYVAGEDDKKTAHTIKVKMRTRSPWPAGLIDSMCFGHAGLHLWPCGGTHSHVGRIGKKALRRQLDAFERMYRELYEGESA